MATADESHNLPGTVRPAFTSSSADVVFRSSDGVSFRVHKQTLSDVSPFKDMFTLPKSAEDTECEGLPVIPVSEDSTVLNTLLQCCYPTKCPSPQSIDEVRQVFNIVDKYQMLPVIMARFDGFLRRPEILEKEPWREYALVCRGGLADLAELAAKQTLRQPLPGESVRAEELQPVSGLAAFNLVRYREQCASLIRPLLSNLDLFLEAYQNSPLPPSTDPCGSSGLQLPPMLS